MKILSSIFSLCLLAAVTKVAAGQSDPDQIRQLVDGQRYAEAEQRLESALETNPDDPQLLLLQGITLLQRTGEVSLLKKMGYSRRGRQALERAVALDPALIEAWKELSDFYYYAPAIAGGSRSKSLEMLETVRALDEAYYLQVQASRQADQ